MKYFHVFKITTDSQIKIFIIILCVKNRSYSAKSVYSFSIHKKVSNSGLFLPFFEAVKDQNNDENG